MCDTLVALGNCTADGAVIFAKNSDREPNEAQYMLLIPAATHSPDEQVQCTYRSLPQVERTNAVLLSKPFWMWGAEMGANEHGVVIGNEAVFTRVENDKTNGLIGMDFLRLALERANTAFGALQVIVQLLEQYGQGGNCGFTHPFYYHNSFIIADRQDAWVLETAGRHWAAEQVKTVRSISNALTIGNTWDLVSQDLVQYAIDRGWCRSQGDFNFARCYSDRIYTPLSDAAQRQSCTMTALEQSAGKLTVRDAMANLRSHRTSTAEGWRPDRGLTGADVCMHAGFGPVRASQTAGSLVAHLSPNGDTFWWTGTAAPCTSIFKPVWIDAGLPDFGPVPEGTDNADSLFWRHERLHRRVLQNYAASSAVIHVEQQEIEQRFVAQAAILRQAKASERLAFSEECFQSASAVETHWQEQIEAIPPQKQNWLYQSAWNRYNERAKFRQSIP